jgi:cell division protein FtsB
MESTTPASPPPKKATAAGSRPRGRRFVQYACIVLGGLLVLDGLVGEKGVIEILKARQDYRQLEDALRRVRTENGRMRTQARLLREDPETIERVARERLGFMKPGERVFILKDAPPTKP